MKTIHSYFVLGLLIILTGSTGCVRRTARFTTIPEGARVIVNDQEIGRTPATMEFTWYGDYDVIYRLENHETIRTHITISPPWYQLIPFDFFAEVLWPGMLHDHHNLPSTELQSLQPVQPEEVAQRAAEMREQALSPDE